jgi:hypothetical protein
MNKFLKENWFKLIIVIILLIVGLVAVYCFVIIIPRQQQQASNAANNLALQGQCANAADKFYTNNGGYKSIAGVNTSYQDHFNSQLNKCFILISSYMPSDDSLGIDLYDALGGQHYASFVGHQTCDPATLAITHQNLNKCELDAGNIWANGDDTSSSTYQIGWSGILHGGQTGDWNTLPQFMAHIQPFMSN